MKARNMVLCALFAALLTVCAWISIPTADIAFTLQTFGVFLTLGLLGGKRGTAAIGVYLCMGAIGLPVFTGFRGGLGVLLGATGGYIAGFLALGVIFWLVTALFPGKAWAGGLGFLLGLLCCYALGTAWFYYAWLREGSSLGIGLILAKCVLPYLIPDGIKLWLALFLTKRIKPIV